MVFCISLTTHCCRDFSFTSFFICSSSFSIPQPKHRTTEGTILTMKRTRHSRIPNANMLAYLQFSPPFLCDVRLCRAGHINYPNYYYYYYYYYYHYYGKVTSYINYKQAIPSPLGTFLGRVKVQANKIW